MQNMIYGAQRMSEPMHRYLNITGQSNQVLKLTDQSNNQHKRYMYHLIIIGLFKSSAPLNFYDGRMKIAVRRYI